MLKAALIEDDAVIRSFISEKLKNGFKQHHELIEIVQYEDAQAFLKRLTSTTHYDILFLDIEMPGMDGITLASKIKAIFPHALIVFISSQDQLVFRSFEVQPFRFIRKNYFEKEMEKLILDILAKIHEKSKNIIYITEASTGDIYSFDVNDLLYAEAQRKDCRMVTASRDTLIRCTMNDMKNNLEPWGFIQCHRSYLVNWRAIYQIGKSEIQLINHTVIPLSRSLSSKVHGQFISLVQSEEE